jgi:hypothetical protein
VPALPLKLRGSRCPSGIISQLSYQRRCATPEPFTETGSRLTPDLTDRNACKRHRQSGCGQTLPGIDGVPGSDMIQNAEKE